MNAKAAITRLVTRRMKKREAKGKAPLKPKGIFKWLAPPAVKKIRRNIANEQEKLKRSIFQIKDPTHSRLKMAGVGSSSFSGSTPDTVEKPAKPLQEWTEEWKNQE